MKKLIFTLFSLVTIYGYTPITPITPIMTNKAKAKLGMKLFFDSTFSATKMVSCRSCHNPMVGWADMRKVSRGVYGKLGNVQSPTVLNSVYNFKQFWNGRAKSLKDQIDDMEKEIAELRDEVNRFNDNYSVPPSKSLVTKKSIYEMIIFEK